MATPPPVIFVGPEAFSLPGLCPTKPHAISGTAHWSPQRRFSLSRGTGAEGEQELAAEPALLGLPRARSQAAGEGKTRLCFGGWRLRTAADTREAGIRLSAPKPSAAGAEIKREHGGNPMVLFPFGSYEANLVHPGSA